MSNSKNSDLNGYEQERMENFAFKLKEVQGYNSTFVDGLLESKKVGFENMETLGLPMYKRLNISIVDFLDDTGVLSSLGTNLYYIILSPKNKNLTRLSKSGLTKEQVTNFVSHNIDKRNFNEYDIIIQQFFPNKYGGNVVIKDDGGIIVEFCEGKQSGITTGKLPKSKLYHVERKSSEISFKYSFEDEHLRRMIFRVLQKIPNEDLRDFRPGYFEFIIGDDNGQDKIIFIDARLNKSYNV